MKPEIPIQQLKAIHRPFYGRFDLLRWGKMKGAYDFSKPHRHSYFEILIIFKGGGLHEIDFTQYPVKSRSIHLVAVNSVHILRRNKNSDGATILFSDDFFAGDESLSRFFKHLFQDTSVRGHVLKFSSIDFISFRSLFDEMEEEFLKNDLNSEILLKSLLAVFLAKTEKYFRKQPPGYHIVSSNNPIVEQYQLFVEKDFHLHHSVKDYASALHISPKHLNELCKKHLSVNAQKVIHNRLLLEIKRLLVHSDLPVKEICYQTGFEDPAHFNHFFRFYMGITPLQYRKSAR